jgi:hypothetical protein
VHREVHKLCARMWCSRKCIGCAQGCDKCSGSGDYKVCDQKVLKVVHKDVVIGVFWSGQGRGA